jgi:hypothetical protein
MRRRQEIATIDCQFGAGTCTLKVCAGYFQQKRLM